MGLVLLNISSSTTLILYLSHAQKWAGIAQSVKRLATGWTVRGSDTGGGEISAPVQTVPGAHSASYTMGTGSFPGGKGPERGVDHPTPSRAEVKEGVEVHL